MSIGPSGVGLVRTGWGETGGLLARFGPFSAPVGVSRAGLGNLRSLLLRGGLSS